MLRAQLQQHAPWGVPDPAGQSNCTDCRSQECMRTDGHPGGNLQVRGHHGGDADVHKLEADVVDGRPDVRDAAAGGIEGVDEAAKQDGEARKRCACSREDVSHWGAAKASYSLAGTYGSGCIGLRPMHHQLSRLQLSPCAAPPDCTCGGRANAAEHDQGHVQAVGAPACDAE